MSYMKQIISRCVNVAVVALTVAVVGGATHDVYAASGGLTISPTSVDVQVPPGGSYQGHMLVINQSELDTDYTVYATPYSVSGEDYQPDFALIPGAVDITRWFTFGGAGGHLKIGDEATVPFTISVPAGTGASSYYATVFAETHDKGGTGVIARKRVGMVVYLRVSGPATERGSVAAWNVPWLQEAPLTAQLKMANEGTIHFQSRITVTVSDLFGSQKFSYERTPEIIPQRLRGIPITWENGATFGLFTVSGDVSYLGKTEHLPTRIVFIATMPMRMLTVGLVLAFAATVVFWGRRRVATIRKN